MIHAIAIIGYGKFGKVTEKILKETTHCPIHIYDPHKREPHVSHNLKETIHASDLIIIATPLKHFKSSVQEIAVHLRPNHTIMEVCSTNTYPKKILLEYVPKNINLIGSHPMFGPQTLACNNNKLEKLNFVIENIRGDKQVYDQIYNFLKSTGVHVIEMEADEHDKKAAKFHFLAQLIGNSLQPMCLEQTQIDTVSYEFLFNFMKRLDPDPDLLDMMYTYNPYSKKYLDTYKTSFMEIYTRLKNQQPEI